MTSASVTRLLLFASTVTLTACGMSPQQETPPKPSASVSVAVSQEATALCLEWKGSEPSWEDADTEKTKDLIDLAIRIRQRVCAPYVPA